MKTLNTQSEENIKTLSLLDSNSIDYLRNCVKNYINGSKFNDYQEFRIGDRMTGTRVIIQQASQSNGYKITKKYHVELMNSSSLHSFYYSNLADFEKDIRRFKLQELFKD